MWHALGGCWAKPSFEATLSPWGPSRTGRCVRSQAVQLTRKGTARCDVAVWISKTKFSLFVVVSGNN
jgi:hypothetical protein